MKRAKDLFSLFTNRLRFSRLFMYKIAFMFLLKYEGASGDRNGSKTEETVFFCFFVVLPPQGQIGLTKLLDSEGQSICLLRLYCLSLSYDICKLARVETIGSTRCSSYHDYTEPKVLEYFNRALNK